MKDILEGYQAVWQFPEFKQELQKRIDKIIMEKINEEI
jgi:hypothetical protein